MPIAGKTSGTRTAAGSRRPPPRGGTAAARAGAPSPMGPDVHVLGVPYTMRELASAAGARWDKGAKAYVYVGRDLPETLRPYASRPYSLERWREDTLRGLSEPSPAGPPGWAGTPMVLRPHQVEARDAILAAMDAGRSSILVADDVGVGKSAPAAEAALDSEPDSVLIVCPMHAIAHWRNTIARLGDRGRRIVIINYERLSKVCEAPDFVPSKPGSRRSKPKRIRSLKGKARYGIAIPFDVVLVDECHKAKNVDSARSKLVAKISAAAEFTIWMSATAGQNPLELAYLAGLLCEVTGDRASDLAEFEAWCKTKGFSVARRKFGRWSWGEVENEDGTISIDRAARDADLERMRDLLFGGELPLGIRRTPADLVGWPSVQRIPVPVTLEPEDALAYQEAWREFREAQGLSRVRKDKEGSLVAQLRFRQKASLLRTQGTVDYALDMLEQGFSVAISVQFLESLDVIAHALRAKGHVVSEIRGSGDPERKEAERLAFQRGEARVCLFTVVDAISLHQGELDPADPRARVSVVHDARWSAIDVKQIEGRTHRDGRCSNSIMLYADGTAEEHVVKVVAEKLRDTGVMMGDGDIVEQIETVMETFARRNALGIAA